MLTNIPISKFYSVSSVDSISAPLAIGSIEDLDYFADLVHDEQLLLQVGVGNDECLLLFKLPWEELASIIDTSRENKKNGLHSEKN